MIKASFRFDKRFLYIALLELLLIVLIFSAGFAWNRGIMGIGEDIGQLRNQMESLKGLSLGYATQMRDETAADILSKIITYSAAAILFILLAWTLLKHKIYNIATGTGFSKRTYWRFVIATLVWAVFAFIVFTILQSFVYMVFGSSFETSFWSRMAVFLLLSIIVLVLFWWGVNLFTHLVREGRVFRAIRTCWQTGLKNMGRFIIPLVASLILIVLVNAVMYLFMFLNFFLFLIGSTLLIVFYATWLRLYCVSIIDGIVQVRRPELHRLPKEKIHIRVGPKIEGLASRPRPKAKKRVTKKRKKR